MNKYFPFLALMTLIWPAIAQPVTESAGPSARGTPITISEIMYKPASRTDGRNLEFIEIYNSNPWTEDIGKFQITGLINFTFPTNATIPGRSYLVVAAVPADITAIYGIANVTGPYTNTLKTSGAIKLYDEQGTLLLNVEYDRKAPWPMGAAGSGHSIVLARASYGEGAARAWERSELSGGSPGAAEILQTNALRNVFINEILAHTDLPQVDSIELYNHSTNAVDISGCKLSDDAATNKFTIPGGTVIPARGFVVFTENQFGFGLDAAGETVYFRAPNGTNVLDAIEFGAQENGVAFGRQPDGFADWTRLNTPTLGTNNASQKISDISFNEIMYNPLVGGDTAQYVEFFNHGTNAINLAGWKLGGGVSWTFASNQVVAAGGYLVVGADKNYLQANYAQLNATNLVGNFSGKLSGSGERITLSMPDTTVSPNGSGGFTTNFLDIVVDEVTYGTGGRWGRWSDGDGSSLEVIDPRSDKRRAANWGDSDDTAKSSWATIEATGVLDNGGLYNGSISQVHLGLLDSGECLVDNIEARPGTNGDNYVANPNFDSGLTHWQLLGDHSRSSLETNTGYPAGGPALHLRTADSMEVGPNNLTVSLTNIFTAGNTATLRFKARWLRGCPEPLIRVRGCYLEATGRLPVPTNLGSPGLANSRQATNSGPAIFEVTHSPAIPAANQSVVVSARATDPDGIANLAVRYRFEPSFTLTNMPMNDAGTNGDAVAGDGLYSATLPGRPAPLALQFTVTAADNLGATNIFPELVPDNAPLRECVVVFGDANPTNLFGTYHLWLSQTNIDRWNLLPVMSNEDIDGTLVYNGRVIYNMGGRYSGSPWHQNYDGPAGNKACHYVWSMPKDDLLLGASSFNKIHWPGNDIQYDTVSANNNDPTIQREQAANTFLRGLGAPWMYRRFVAVYVNGVRRGSLMEDAFRPNSRAARKLYFPDDTNGQYYKLQAWYEFPTNSFASFSRISWCDIARYTTTGGEFKPARYRNTWALNYSEDNLSNFTNVYTLGNIAAASAQPDFPELLESVADMENWIRVSAANHAAGNWDCFGSTGSGQNAYAWISAERGWTLFTIDFGICLGNSIADGAGANIFSFYDPVWNQIYSKPKFKRMYYRALKELVNGPMLTSRFNAIMNAKHAAFQAAGLSLTSPIATESWVSTARSSIASQVAAADVAGFSCTTNNYIAASNAVALTGVAPFQVTTIWVNGKAFTPTWITATNWSILLPVAFGTNAVTLAATDRYGNSVGSNSVTVASSFQPESAIGNLVINEILYHPTKTGGEFIELLNRATNTTFDLSGWKLNGMEYTFPSGSILEPGKFLLLAKNRPVFANLTGGLTPVFDEFSGSPSTSGETLSLLNGSNTVDAVRYESTAPWPANPALAPGLSLQLVDASRDNSRVANWSSAALPASLLPTNLALVSFDSNWRFMQISNLDSNAWTVLNYNDAAWPSGNGLLAYENNPAITGLINTALNDPLVGTNSLPGGSARYFRLKLVLTNDPAMYSFQASVYADDGMVVYVNGTEVTRLRMNAGSVSNSTLANAQPPGSDATVPEAFTIPASAFNTGTNIIAVSIHQVATNSSDIVFGMKLDATRVGVDSGIYATPGYANSVATNLPAFPDVWLNEVQVQNVTGRTDNNGERDPWVELYNSGTNTLDLSGFYLSTNYNNVTNWIFPAGATLAPGKFAIVWLDGQPAQTSGTNWHTGFRLDNVVGKIALARVTNGAPQILDYLTHLPLTANYSYGDFPDGQPFYRQAMFNTTPGNSNNAASAPVAVFINEWMAENTSFMIDPATGAYEDWFEIYNPSGTPADLSGYYLTDLLSNPFQYQIPAGFIVPGNGFLLVWADNKTSANTNTASLHVTFKLSKGGEALGLYAANGTAIDTLTFGAQTANVTEGRFPDGGALRLFMPAPSPAAPNILPAATNTPTITTGALQVGNAFKLTFQTSPGHTYRVEYKLNLNDPAWTPLGTDQFATTNTISINDPASATQRFYRINMVQ